MCASQLSTIRPCNGGIQAPPNIIITSNEEPCVVYFPSPAMARVKMQGHITEQNSPPLINENRASVPLVNRPSIIILADTQLKRVNVKAGLSLPIKNMTIAKRINGI